MMDEDLYVWLTTTPSIVALFADRVYHEWAPQSIATWPVLVYRLVSSVEIAPDMDAPNDEKIDNPHYQFDVYARSSAEVLETAKAFDAVFRNFRGTMGAARIQMIERANVSHLGEIVGDKAVRRVSLDYSIFFG